MTSPLQTLECRRLLSFTPEGGEAVVAGGVVDPVVDVAVADDGSSHIVATELQRGDVRHITAFRYDASGELLGGPITLYRYVQTDVWSNVSVAMDADGDAVVAYAVDDGADGGLFFNRISRTGEVAPTLRVAAGQDMSVRSPAVAMNRAGQFYLGWIAEAEGWDDRAMVRAYAVDGTVRGPEYIAARTVELTQFGTFGSIDVLVQPFSSVAAFTVSLQAASDNEPTRHSVWYGVLGTARPATSIQKVDGVGDAFGPTLSFAPFSEFAVGYIGQTTANDSPALRVVNFRIGSDGNDAFLTDDGVADRIRGGPGDDSADADSLDDVLDVESVT